MQQTVEGAEEAQSWEPLRSAVLEASFLEIHADRWPDSAVDVDLLVIANRVQVVIFRKVQKPHAMRIVGRAREIAERSGLSIERSLSVLEDEADSDEHIRLVYTRMPALGH